MRKASQDGGDNCSISSSLENEFKKPGAGILKSTRNSIKRKVQNLNTEVDEAVVEPLLQKDEESVGKNLCAKSLLSKSYQTKTDHDKSEECNIKYTSQNVIVENGTKYANKEALITTFTTSITTENDSVSKSSIPTTDDKNIITSTNTNKHFKTVISIPTGQIASNAVEVHKTWPCDNISTAVGYIPSSLIFTTAKIHADTKCKDLTHININAIPILSTAEIVKSTPSNNISNIDSCKPLKISSIEQVTKNTPTSTISSISSTYDKGVAAITELKYAKSVSPGKQTLQLKNFMPQVSNETKLEIETDAKNVRTITFSPSDVNANRPENISAETSLGLGSQNDTKVTARKVVPNKVEIHELSKTKKDIKISNGSSVSHNISSISSSASYETGNPVEYTKINTSKTDKSGPINKTVTKLPKNDDKSDIMMLEKINQSPSNVSHVQSSKSSTLKNGNRTNIQFEYDPSSTFKDTHLSSQKVNSIQKIENKIEPKPESAMKSSTIRSPYAVTSSITAESKGQNKIAEKTIDAAINTDVKINEVTSKIEKPLVTNDSEQKPLDAQKTRLQPSDFKSDLKISEIDNDSEKTNKHFVDDRQKSSTTKPDAQETNNTGVTYMGKLDSETHSSLTETTKTSSSTSTGYAISTTLSASIDLSKNNVNTFKKTDIKFDIGKETQKSHTKKEQPIFSSTSSMQSTLQKFEPTQKSESKLPNKISGGSVTIKGILSPDSQITNSSTNFGKIQQAKQLQRQRNTTESDDVIGSKVIVSKSAMNPSEVSSTSSSTKIEVINDAKITSKPNAIKKNIQATKSTVKPEDSKNKLTKSEGRLISSNKDDSKVEESKSKASKS